LIVKFNAFLPYTLYLFFKELTG